MPRIARVVVPGIPHHVTQRGNRRQPTFFGDGDYAAYLALMAKWLREHRVAVWAYCLMPNHVHLVAVPETEDGLRRGIGEAHRRYTLRVNRREGWQGHLWQGRFASFPMDEPHLLMAARYVERNPVRAGLAVAPWEYRWSSAAAHVDGRGDALVETAPLLKIVPDWRGFLEGPSEDDLETLRRHERTGRPAGDDAWVERIGRSLGRDLAKKKRGPKGPRGR